MTLRTLSKYAGAALVLAVTFTGGTFAASASSNPPERKPAEPAIPHCATEDGGPQPVCIWDSAVDGNKTPAAPHNVVFLYVTRPGQDPEGIRLK